MKKLSLLMTLFLCFISASSHVSAMEVKPENFGAIVNDGEDDSVAVQSAIDALLQQGGGTVSFPSGKLNLKRPLMLLPTSSKIGVEIKLQGTRGSILEVSPGINNIVFFAGNLNSLNLEDLIIMGKKVSADSPDFYDASYIVVSSYVQQTNIIRCQFYGLAVPNGAALIYIGNTDARIADSQFDGSLGSYPDGAVILAENARGLTVTRSTFIDYANVNGEYLSKSWGFTGSWIKVKNTDMVHNANGIRRVLIEDSRFDEAASSAISIENVPWADIRGINVNVNGTDVGKGIYLKDVEYAKIEQSWFGYTNSSRPALDLVNVQGLEATALKFGGGVYFSRNQNVGETIIKFCPQCNLPTLKR